MKISIITVCLNSINTIEATICSVLSQTHRNTEHIIVDGGSTDGTRELLELYQDKIDTVISGPDNGLYDAMNKGIVAASGEVIGILNSDDCYASDNVLEKVCQVFSDQQVDTCYGDLIYTHPDNKGKTIRYWKAGPFKYSSLFYGWMPPHPSFFVRKRCYSAYGFYRTDLNTSADYELMLRFLLKHRLSAVYIADTLVNMRAGGKSNASLTKRLRAHLMDWRAWRVNGLRPYPWTIPLKPLRKIHQWFLKE